MRWLNKIKNIIARVILWASQKEAQNLKEPEPVIIQLPREDMYEVFDYERKSGNTAINEADEVARINPFRLPSEIPQSVALAGQRKEYIDGKEPGLVIPVIKTKPPVKKNARKRSKSYKPRTKGAIPKKKHKVKDG